MRTKGKPINNGTKTKWRALHWRNMRSRWKKLKLSRWRRSRRPRKGQESTWYTLYYLSIGSIWNWSEIRTNIGYYSMKTKASNGPNNSKMRSKARKRWSYWSIRSSRKLPKTTTRQSSGEESSRPMKKSERWTKECLRSDSLRILRRSYKASGGAQGRTLGVPKSGRDFLFID